MSNFIYEGNRVRVVFDKGTTEEEIRKGTVGRVGGYVGLQGPRYPVKYDGKSWIETRYYYTKKRLTNLIEECKLFEKDKIPALLKSQTFKSCPFCNVAYDSDFSQEGWRDIEKKEFKLRGLCVKCQKEIFLNKNIKI